MGENIGVNDIGYYAIIPAKVFFNKDLNSNEKILYGLVSLLLNEKGYCTATNSYLGEALNVSPRTVSRWISKINKLDFFKVFFLKSKTGEILERRIYIKNTPIEN